MMKQRKIWAGILAAIGMLMLILDSETALKGANDGISLSLRTVIPSLFPFIIISQFVNTSFAGISMPFFKPIQKICAIPEGAESIFLLGLIGGYPVGAQSLANAYVNGFINKEDAKRMLGFCSNAGPAFIFGMAAGLFSSWIVTWILWIIQLLSAVMVGILLPGRTQNRCIIKKDKPFSLSAAIENGAKTMGLICAWVIFFRIVIAFISRWALWILPKELQITVIGLLELANGCCELYTIPLQGLRFVLSSVFLSVGGICVVMQTSTVTKQLGLGMYFPGKVLQGCISFIISCLIQPIIFPHDAVWNIPILVFALIAVTLFLALYLIKKKKTVAIH